MEDTANRCERCDMRAPAKKKLCDACARAADPQAVLDDLARGGGNAATSPPGQPGALSRTQIAVWSVVLGSVAAIFVTRSACSGMRSSTSSHAASQATTNTCYAYITNNGAPDFTSRVAMFPNAPTMKAAKAAIRDADDAQWRALAASATPLDPGSKLTIEAAGQGYYRVTVHDGSASGAVGFVSSFDCHTHPPR